MARANIRTTVLATLIAFACGDADPVGPTGTIDVEVSTSGSLIDANGYTVTVDAGEPRSVDSNGSVTFGGLSPGEHVVELSDVASNCEPGEPTQSVILEADGGVGDVAFAVVCSLVLPKIAFVSDRDGNREIYLADPDGENVFRLTHDAVEDNGPAWSPDGTRIAFKRGVEGGGTESEIYVMSADGSNPVQLTNRPGQDTGADWTPDGTQIVFSGSPGENQDIWIMNADGGGLTQLTDGPWEDIGAAVSPDGLRIAFCANPDGNWDIYTMALDGSDVIRLTDHLATDCYPDWSPDGQWIVFESGRSGDREIHKMRADGSDESRLTHASGEVPVWSPDGSRIGFHSLRDGDYELYTIGPNGENPTRLTDSPGMDVLLDWSPEAMSDVEQRSAAHATTRRRETGSEAR